MKGLLKIIVAPGNYGRSADIGLLIVRVSAGSMMLFAHGWGKLANYGERVSSWADPIGLGSEVSLTLAVFAEFFCSLAVIFGLGTRVAVIPLLVTMLVAALVVHTNDPWAKQELPLLFATVFVLLMLAGPGRISVDNWLARKLNGGSSGIDVSA